MFGVNLYILYNLYIFLLFRIKIMLVSVNYHYAIWLVQKEQAELKLMVIEYVKQVISFSLPPETSA